MKAFATILAVLGACALVSGSSVPVLLWGSQFNHATPVSAVREYQHADFTQLLGEHPANQIVVFVEDTLTAPELSQHRQSYAGLQAVPSKLYLSSVASPLATIEQLAADQIVSSDAAAIIAAGALPAATNSYVLVPLSAAATDESRPAQLSRHDREMAAITALAGDSNTLFVYTARRSAAVQLKSRVTRQAQQQAPPANGTFFNSERLLIFYTNLTFDGQPLPIASLSATLTNATHVAVRLHGAVQADDITFQVISDGINWWEVGNIEFRGERLFKRDGAIGALPEFSYHCGPIIEFSTVKGVLSPLQWTGLQLEPQFGPAPVQARSNFSEPWDCVGFVSPGMLGGFFVTLLMLVIVTIGLTWIMDIRTMDRFDDPKGKAIVVATSE